jgi:Mce-associated membrane protein
VVSDPASGAGPAATSWRTVNVLLIVLALLMATAVVVLLREGAAATPGDSRAQTMSRQYKEVTRAATRQTEGFLTVDYKRMDPLIDEVLAGATGTFKREYSRARVNLKASAQESQATSTGEVLSVGIADVDDSAAVVFVAANSEVENKSTRGKPQPRYYRLKLTMVKKSGTWLTSNLQFVG